MQDRVPLYPGRVKLTPVSGKENTYDMVRADEPTQEGTHLNKNTLLKDTTAALYGLGADAVPDDALAVLSRFHKGLGNEYVWEKYEQRIVLIDTTFGNNSFAFSSFTLIQYSSEITTDENGNFSLVNPQEFNISLDNAGMSQLVSFAPCYFKTNGLKYIHYLPDGSNYGTTPDKTIYLRDAYNMGFGENATVKAKTPTFSDFFVGYVNSPDPAAYPPSVYDGYTYTALGQLGNKPQIATGSYVGTGTYGSDNKNSLTFDFEPKIVFIGDANGWLVSVMKSAYYSSGHDGYMSTPVVLVGDDYSPSEHPTKRIYAFINGNKMQWFSEEARFQLNTNSNIYNYIAIG